MKALMAFMLALVVAALVLVVSTPARQGAERLLFGKRTSPEPASAPVTSPGPEAPKAEEPPGTPAPVAAAAPEEAPAVAVAAPKPEQEPAPAQTPPKAAEPAAPPAPQPVGEPPRARTGTQQVVLPPALASAAFGMSSAQIGASYATAWSRQEAGELMLVSYLTQDKGQMVRFHFSGDSLYLIEARLKPAQGETVKSLYDSLQAQYAARFADVADISPTHWSDGSVIARLETAGDSVQVSYSCPRAKAGG